MTRAPKLSPGCFAQALGRAFDCVEKAEAHARQYLRETSDDPEPRAPYVTIFLGCPGCVPCRLWNVDRVV